MDVKTIQLVLEKSKKRRFPQTFELIVNLKPTYDLRKSENTVVDYVELPKGRGKKVRIAAIVGPELEKIAKEIFDEVLIRDNLKEFAQNKRKAKEFAKRNYHIVAQVSVMPDVGRYLGRYLGPRDKMPNPRYGMIFPDNANEQMLRALYDRLQKLVRVVIKKHITFGIPIGTENMDPKDVAENAKHVVNWLLNRIPGGRLSIRSIYLKLTMGPAVRIF